MTGLEDIMQAAMSAPPERREEALRLLQGRLPKPEPFLTLARLSQRLGFSTTTLRRWRVPSHDLAAHPRYRLTEVQAYFQTDAFQRRRAAVRAERRRERTMRSTPDLATAFPGRADASESPGPDDPRANAL